MPVDKAHPAKHQNPSPEPIEPAPQNPNEKEQLQPNLTPVEPQTIIWRSLMLEQ
jgi:hypothetical protein